MIIESDIVKAEEGKILIYKPDNIICGKAARLVTYKGHQRTVEDFEEIDEDLVINIDGTNYTFVDQSYAEIKTFIIKLHYSNDDQIALMLNYQNNPSKYEQAYQNMQNWRDYAGNIASKYVINK